MAFDLTTYDQLRNVIRRDFMAGEVTEALARLSDQSLDFVGGCDRQALKSVVPGKDYFAFGQRDVLSRPINAGLFLTTREPICDFWERVARGGKPEADAESLTRACYTIAASFCAALDLAKPGSQKTSGTYLEYLIGHLFAKQFGVNPRKQLEVLNLDEKATLPTDFVFDLGRNQPKFHLPVKTSTRERIIQVWAHQRVLDGVYGTGRFLGVLVCLAETKLNRRTLQVTEICLPEQWKLYQLFIAQMKRIYYLDVPRRYSELDSGFPRIPVRPFGEFFHEAETLAES